MSGASRCWVRWFGSRQLFMAASVYPQAWFVLVLINMQFPLLTGPAQSYFKPWVAYQIQQPTQKQHFTQKKGKNQPKAWCLLRNGPPKDDKLWFATALLSIISPEPPNVSILPLLFYVTIIKLLYAVLILMCSVIKVLHSHILQNVNITSDPENTGRNDTGMTGDVPS